MPRSISIRTARPRAAITSALSALSFAVAATVASRANAQSIPTIHIAVGPGPGSASSIASTPVAPMRVTSAPPVAAPVDITPRTPAPAPNTVWRPGSWTWQGGGYGWNGGEWVVPPTYGSTWIPPRWERREGYVLYYPGYWSNAVEPVVHPYVPSYAPTVFTHAGTLNDGMPMTPMGTYYNDFAVPLVAGQTVTFVVRGGAAWMGPGPRLDPLIQLYASGSLLAEDDDGAGGQDSRIVFTARWTGTFTLRVTTYGTGPSTGTYVLTAQNGIAY